MKFPKILTDYRVIKYNFLMWFACLPLAFAFIHHDAFYSFPPNLSNFTWAPFLVYWYDALFVFASLKFYFFLSKRAEMVPEFDYIEEPPNSK